MSDPAESGKPRVAQSARPENMDAFDMPISMSRAVLTVIGRCKEVTEIVVIMLA
jgi:hypothetical protein